MKMTLIIALLFSNSIYSQSTVQEKIEEKIKTYLKTILSDSNYTPYFFETAYKTTPNKIIDVENYKYLLDSLKKIHLLTTKDSAIYDSIIKTKTKEIKKLKLCSFYDINHYFTKNDKTLIKCNFELYPNGKIKKINMIDEFHFKRDELFWYKHYFYKKTLFKRNKNKSILTYKLIDKIILNEKTNLPSCIRTMLALIKTINKYQYIDQNKITKTVLINWFKEYKPTSRASIISKTTPLNDPINKKKEYKTYVLFKENDTIKALKFEMDLNYIIRNITEIKKPHEKYFK